MGSPYTSDHSLLREVLTNAGKKFSLPDRFRALFMLKNIGDDESIDIICSCFDDTSVLLKHELAYVLGQMQSERSQPKLCSVLEDEEQDTITRHEAGEALGAIGSLKSLDILRKYSKHTNSTIADTCLIAIERIENYHNKNSQDYHLFRGPKGIYSSIDPAPADSSTNIEELERTLLDVSQHMYKRYKAMFALRNIGGNESALSLAKGLKDSSALFKHEIAYVLGQMQNPIVVNALSETLKDEEEAGMVRHECAEALGAIANDEAHKILFEHINDKTEIVRESCCVALDILEYHQGDALEYELPKVKSKELKEA